MNPIFEELYAQAIGTEVIKYLSGEGTLKALAREADSAAIRTLADIQAVLNDDTLDDPACFRRVGAIVELFRKSGLSTTRHDF